MRLFLFLILVLTLLFQHEEPKQTCSHSPKAEQVKCACENECNADGTPKEDAKCKSWCHPKWCKCPKMRCD